MRWQSLSVQSISICGALGCAVWLFLANGMAVFMADLHNINMTTVLFPSKSDFALTLSTAVPCSVPCSCPLLLQSLQPDLSQSVLFFNFCFSWHLI